MEAKPNSNKASFALTQSTYWDKVPAIDDEIESNQEMKKKRLVVL